MVFPFSRRSSKNVPAPMPNEVPTPQWGNTAEEGRFSEFSALPSNVSQAELEAIAQEDARMKEGVKRLEEYAKHAKGVTESLVKAHEIRADYIQHVFGCVQSFHKTNGQVFKAGLQHREKLNAIYDALGIAQAEFTGKQEARGLDSFRENWRR